ncbi:LAETG motif-containing sortase-dependent surface protein [Yinghuangia sp. YIM S09857]|uniref:LAETG motif-containing sortase-dependent surface protein n=1 Tax=Yinghuangia sp. YIM S09857 TaxID=3436929 RepID=UPI003F52A90F
MQSARVSRRGAVVLAAVVSSSIAVVGLAGTAHAERAKLSVSVWPESVSLPLPPPGGGSVNGAVVSPYIWYTSAGDPAKNVVVTFDGAGIAGFAEFEKPYPVDTPCVTTSTKITCTFPTLEQYANVPGFRINAKQTAVEGDHGTVKVTARADNADVSVTTPEIEVGAGGPDLSIEAPGPVTGLKGGDTLNVPFSVRSNGADPGKFVLRVDNGRAQWRFQEQFKNCLYSDYGMVCVLDQPLTKGGNYTAATPVQVKVPEAVAVDGFSLGVDVYDEEEFEEFVRSQGYVPGTGSKAFALAQQPTAKALPDNSPWNNVDTLRLETILSADLALVNGHVVDAGTPGQWALTADLRNLGPGAVYENTDTRPLVRVDLPTGARVVDGRIEMCRTSVKGAAYGSLGTGDGVFLVCWTTEYLPLAAANPWQVRVMLDAASVPAGSSAKMTMSTAPYDKNNANQTITVPLVLTAPGGTTGGTTGGTGTPGTGPSASPGVSTGGAATGAQPPADGGSELADTGDSSSTPVIAGVAGGLLVVAAGAFVVVRRRKGGGAAAA